MRQRLLSGLGWSTAGRVAALLGSLATNALLARILAPNDVGAYFIISALTGVLAVMSLLGLNQAVVRLVPEALALGRPAEARRTLELTIALGAAASCLVGLALGAVGRFLLLHVFGSPSMADARLFIALLVPVTALRALVPEAFRGLSDIKRASIFSDGASNLSLAAVLAGVFAVSTHTRLVVVLVAVLATGAVLIAWSLLQLGTEARRLPKGGHRPLWPMLRVSLPMLGANLSWVILGQIDLVILGAFRSNADVAYYGAADRIANVLIFPILITNAVIAPLIAELWYGNRRLELRRVLQGTATLTTVACGAGLVIVCLGAGPLLGTVFGEFYRRGAAVLIALAVGAFLNAATGPSALALLMTGQQVSLLVVTASVAVLTTLTVAWTASAYGSLGVAISTTMGITALNVGTLLLAKRRLNIWTLPSIGAVATALRRMK